MGPSNESLALADYLIAKFGLQVDRIRLAYAIMGHVEVEYAEDLEWQDRALAAEASLAATGKQQVGEVHPVFADEDMPPTLSTVTPPTDLRTKLGEVG